MADRWRDRRFALRLRSLLPWETFAPHQLGALWATGTDGPLDERQALRWYTLGARRGDAESQYDLGFMILLGEGTAADPERALDWLHRAAVGGHPSAASLLAALYRDGLHGVPIDAREAARWEREAARATANGSPPSASPPTAPRRSP